MEKTFIEGLWEKNPELVMDKLSELLDIKRDDLIHNKEVKGGGYLAFCIRPSYMLCNQEEIIVNDYEIRFVKDRLQPAIVDEWLRFMYENCGAPYAMKYIKKSNKELDIVIAKYKERHNKKLTEVLKVMGYLTEESYTK